MSLYTDPCVHAKDEFRKWLSSSDPSNLRFRRWCLEHSKKMYKQTGMKGFMTLEFDQPEDAIAYIMFLPERDGCYSVIKDEGIPLGFKSVYDGVNLDTHFLLYVVFGKKHPNCTSIMREVEGSIQ
jgi:hypothetical protein